MTTLTGRVVRGGAGNPDLKWARAEIGRGVGGDKGEAGKVWCPRGVPEVM